MRDADSFLIVLFFLLHSTASARVSTVGAIDPFAPSALRSSLPPPKAAQSLKVEYFAVHRRLSCRVPVEGKSGNRTEPPAAKRHPAARHRPRHWRDPPPAPPASDADLYSAVPPHSHWRLGSRNLPPPVSSTSQRRANVISRNKHQQPTTSHPATAAGEFCPEPSPETLFQPLGSTFCPRPSCQHPHPTISGFSICGRSAIESPH